MGKPPAPRPGFHCFHCFNGGWCHSPCLTGSDFHCFHRFNGGCSVRSLPGEGVGVELARFGDLTLLAGDEVGDDLAVELGGGERADASGIGGEAVRQLAPAVYGPVLAGFDTM